MYKDHNPPCREFMQDSPYGMYLGGVFVQSTIQERSERLEQIMESVRSVGAQKTKKAYWGNKVKAVDHMYTNMDEIHENLMKFIRSKKDVHYKCMDYITQIPNFGLAKAGFYTQLLTGGVGCLDSHNCKIYGVEKKDLSISGVSDALRQKRIRMYLDLCKVIGGSRYLWNQWCNYVASLYPKVWRDGFHVSELHVRCLHY